jgi:glycosyltransferase involved in cell wall biosynthesis
MMQKLFHIPNYYPPSTGGIEFICYQIVSCLQNFEHSVFCFSGSSHTIIDEYEGIRVVRCGRWQWVSQITKGFNMSLGCFNLLKKELRRFQPDFIHIHLPNPVMMFYLLLLCPKRAKLIAHYHFKAGFSPRWICNLIHFVYSPFERLLFRRADKILVTSPLLQSSVKDLARYERKCFIVENAIVTNDLDLTEADAVRISNLKEKYSNKKILFTFGRHVFYKGLKYLMQAEPYIDKDCEIIIGGTGPLTKKLKQMSRSSRIHFVGYIPDNDLKIYLHAASLFAFPSINSAEAFGLAMAQAMYCCTPAITFIIRESGVNYVNLNNVTGLEVENKNAFQFAQAVNRLLRNEPLQHKMADSAHQRIVENFTTEKMQSKLESIYKVL